MAVHIPKLQARDTASWHFVTPMRCTRVGFVGVDSIRGFRLLRRNYPHTRYNNSPLGNPHHRAAYCRGLGNRIVVSKQSEMGAYCRPMQLFCGPDWSDRRLGSLLPLTKPARPITTTAFTTPSVGRAANCYFTTRMGTGAQTFLKPLTSLPVNSITRHSGHNRQMLMRNCDFSWWHYSSSFCSIDETHILLSIRIPPSVIFYDGHFYYYCYG